MKSKKVKLKAKGKEKSKLEKQLDSFKRQRGIEREAIIESGEFHAWMPQSRVHTDKKKKNNKKSSRQYKYKGEE
jgi:hypothetical protein